MRIMKKLGFSSSNDKKQHESVKVMVLGTAGVGKTSIIQELVGGNEDSVKIHKPTVWDVRDTTINCNGNQMSFTFIETGGSHYFPGMHRLAIKDADMFIMMYCVENKASKDAVIRMLKEIEEIKTERPNKLPIMIVGNKMDLLRNIDIFDNSVNGAFDKDEELSKWSSTQLKVSHKYKINTEIIKEGLFFLYSKFLKKDI